jgi:hypothetical protein
MANTSPDVTTLYEQKFTQIFELLAQQQEARIPGTFLQGNHMGSKGAQAVKQIGKVEMQQRVTRLEPITFADVPHDARWVYPVMWDRAVPFDTWDELQTAADPRSTYVSTLRAGMNRKMDAECIRGFDETSHVGETGSDTTSYPAGNIIAVNFGASGNTGLTVRKLREVRRQMMAAEVDIEMEQIYVVASALQLDNLLSEAQVVSTDFNDKPVLVEGKITRFLGINLIHSELLPTDASAYRKVFAWSSRAMHFGTWQGVQVNITQREDLRGRPWQVYLSSMFGATRLQETKVWEILCSEV